MDDESSAALWRSVCIAERFQSMMFEFPSSTRYYCSRIPDTVYDDGTFIPTNFFFRLSGITLTIGGSTDIRSTQVPLEELEDTCVRLGSELNLLAAEIPPTWWSTADLPLPHRLMQYLFHYIMIRTHLPLVLRRDTSAQSSQSRLACPRACQALLESYLGLCPVLPEGYFIHHLVNLQGFAAIIILVLTEYSAFVPEGQQGAGSCPSPASMNLVSRVAEAMEQNVGRAGFSHARDTLFSIRALVQLLSQQDLGHDKENIVLRVPLLGKLNVQRNESSGRKCHSGQLILPELPQSTTYNLPSDVPLNGVTATPLCWSIEDAYQMLFYEPVDFSDPTNLGFLQDSPVLLT
jgi:hypothetical protein